MSTNIVQNNEISKVTLLTQKLTTNINKLQTLYAQLEAGKISSDAFPIRVEQETGFVWTDKADKVINKSSSKDFNFSSLVKSLDVLQKKKEKLPKFTSNDYRPVINLNRVVDKQKVVLPKGSDENEFISIEVKKLINKKIGTDDFKAKLLKKGIKTDGDDIQIKLKQIDQGNEFSYSELMACVTRYKNEECKLKKIEDNIEKLKAIPAHSSSKFTDQKLPGNKKLYKKDTFNSKKEVFDWEGEELKRAEEYERKREVFRKTRPSSQVFNGDVLNSEFKSILRKNPNDNENFILWASPKNIKKAEIDLTVTPTVPNTKQKSVIKKYHNNSVFSLTTPKSSELKKMLASPASSKNLSLHQSSIKF